MNKLLLLAPLFVIGCTPSQRLVKLSEETLPKTVSIEVNGIMEGLMLKFDGDKFSIEKGTSPVTVTGSGVYITEYNHVLTCDHLFDLFSISTITVCNYYGTCAEADLLSAETALDLALVKVRTNEQSRPVRIGDPRKLKVGQEVFAVGSPLGFPFSVSHGIISALNRDELGIYNMTQSDAFINPGNSGGGLFNLKGELIGINSRMVPPIKAAVFTGLGFSTQSGQIIEFLTRFRGLDKTIPKYGSSYWTKLKEVLGGGLVWPTKKTDKSNE